MNTKDWILLFTPILCNGIVVLVLQKMFERKQQIARERRIYVSELQRKIDCALSSFMKVLQTSGNDISQVNAVNNFVEDYCAVFYYYQQNQKLFEKFSVKMQKLINEHEKMQVILDTLHKTGHSDQLTHNMEDSLRKIYEILQSIQHDCINHKV
ncbi:hypothetical protein [Anaerorhabdus furcosa]|uniref:Uncharacterized protein n=1 Tax=Anaerorhabdus furcosa TaxID=118967 RepID=A0A1T4LD10_9FIRM|nr:hypothetical protein [Anaerorhabdus furcosa]SJZ52629.1 hypothetical protein SAMN02745191_0836 [Anaerorhabdus furcosa]